MDSVALKLKKSGLKYEIKYDLYQIAQEIINLKTYNLDL